MAAQTVSFPVLDTDDLQASGFKVHEHTVPAGSTVVRGRRDYYKMILMTGEATIISGERELEVHDSMLFFVNPLVPHSVTVRSKHATGFACLFTEAFLSGRDRTQLLQHSPLFNAAESPLVELSKEQAGFMTTIFQKMLAVHVTGYELKGDMIRSCIEIIIQEAMRIQPPQHTLRFRNSAGRITHLFLDLLERQFPIERVQEALRLRTAQDFARELSVHTNYLTRSVKEVTGKTTSAVIAERIVMEAKALLQHTDWSIADIGYSLGFEYPTYFNNFFKRLTGKTPRSMRST